MGTINCKICKFVNEADAAVCRRCGTPFRDTPEISSGHDDDTTRDKTMADLKIRRGQVIAQRYVVQEIVGRGGMGRIFKVHDNTLNEDVALKMLLPQFSRDKVVVDRFFNEARIARGLSHPNIVRVHDIGIEGDTVYISMELLKGKSLRGLLDALPDGQRLPVKQVLSIFDGLCAALAYAHQYTIHRDIKPENVMIHPDGTVKLMDFGISKLMGNLNLTSASMVMGTPFYMSPEQVKHSGKVDARSDVYSVGVMLYEVLTGHAPTGIKKPASQISGEVPPALDPIVEKCVDPEPDKRYQSAAELREALARVSRPAESTSFERIPVSVSVSAGFEPQERWTSAAGVVSLLLVATLSAAGLWQAEAKRRDLVSAPQLSASDAWKNLETEDSDPHDRFDVMTGLVSSAQKRARSVMISSADALKQGRDDALLREANGWWEVADDERGTDVTRALDAGWNALHRYLALIFHPEGMIFVPPGDLENDSKMTRTHVAGFFIDEDVVSAEEFWNFCHSTVDWSWPVEYPYSEPNVPMAYVTYYDALAYASSELPGKRLPTENQWIRAIQHAQKTGRLSFPDEPARGESAADDTANDDDAGEKMEAEKEPFVDTLYVMWSLGEWTRTVAAQPPGTSEDIQEITFRRPMVVRGLDYSETSEDVLGYKIEVVYETRVADIGFRCVLELPDTLEKVAALLGQNYL